MPESTQTQIPTTLFPGSEVYAEVIIPLNLPQNYTWQIPEELIKEVGIGTRVEVQLKNKRYSGIIKRLHTDKPKAFQPKTIINVLDEQMKAKKVCHAGMKR